MRLDEIQRKMGTIKNSFIKCIVKAARVNKWDPRFYCGLKRYTLAVLFVEDLPLVHLSLICSESLRMCRKAFKIWHFFVKRLILNTVEMHWISKTMQICLYGSVLIVMITVMMCTQRFMVLLEKWVSVLWVELLYIWMSDVFCCVFAVGKSWTQYREELNSVQRRWVCIRRPWSLIVGSSVLSFCLLERTDRNCLSIALFFPIQKCNIWHIPPY